MLENQKPWRPGLFPGGNGGAAGRPRGELKIRFGRLDANPFVGKPVVGAEVYQRKPHVIPERRRRVGCRDERLGRRELIFSYHASRFPRRLTTECSHASSAGWYRAYPRPWLDRRQSHFRHVTELYPLLCSQQLVVI